MANSSETTNDGAVVAAVLEGDVDRFAELVERYERPLRRVACSRLGRDDWAEDVVQETFLCAFKSLHTYDSRWSFRTWLWTILLNQCNRLHKRQTRKPRLFFWSDEEANEPSGVRTIESTLGDCEATDPPARLLKKERAELLGSLLGRLPQAQADALRLRFFGGLKFQEIADSMGCSLSSAKNRVRWGLEKMGGMLVEAGEIHALADAAESGFKTGDNR